MGIGSKLLRGVTDLAESKGVNLLQVLKTSFSDEASSLTPSVVGLLVLKFLKYANFQHLINIAELVSLFCLPFPASNGRLHFII